MSSSVAFNFYTRPRRLTRMFTLDYSLWFDQMLPGSSAPTRRYRSAAPQNHFKLKVLRELHGWDPFNVTEDADLGIRLTQRATGSAWSIRPRSRRRPVMSGIGSGQRSRWMKGYMQTFLVHTRQPLTCCARPDPRLPRLCVFCRRHGAVALFIRSSGR